MIVKTGQVVTPWRQQQGYDLGSRLVSSQGMLPVIKPLMWKVPSTYSQDPTLLHVKEKCQILHNRDEKLTIRGQRKVNLSVANLESVQEHLIQR